VPDGVLGFQLGHFEDEPEGVETMLARQHRQIGR
jgi:hypothetical protein